MKKRFFAATMVAMLPSPTLATMPLLTDLPTEKSVSACKKWAAAQDEDAVYMWGMLDTGESSSDVGKLRLKQWCELRTKPDIVGFGSSDGFDRSYCKTHARERICDRYAGRRKPR